MAGGEGGSGLGVSAAAAGLNGWGVQGLWAGLKQLWRARWTKWDSVLGSGLMREELCARLGARQLWATMPDGARLDCCLVPTQRVHPSTGRPLGLIIYCQPNAGLYEASALLGPMPSASPSSSSLSGDWVEFYTALGNDVLLFNYRGYGRSEGAPTPTLLRRDIEALVRMVREELGVKRVGVHGESVGGLVAAHAAARCDGVALLVADRTFASLPAVADRLLFAGAGAALRFFSGWSDASMDIVRDYVACPAYKLACQDPANDSVIHETASLKAGVAVRRELLGEDGREASSSSSSFSSSWSLPREYAVADALGHPPASLLGLTYPTPDTDDGPAADAAFTPLLPSTPQSPLTERGVMHFAACCIFLTKRAREQDRRDSDATASALNSTTTDPATKRLSPSSRHEATRRRLWSLQQRGFGSFDDEEEGSSEEDGGSSSWGLSGGGASSASFDGNMGSSSEEEDEEELMRSGSYQDPYLRGAQQGLHHRGGSRSPTPPPHPTSPGGVVPLQRWGRQEGVVASGWGREPPSSPGGSMLGCSAVQQAWRTLARCDGLCGLMLGQAVAMGGASPSDAGAIRAWICSLVVWGPGQEALSLLGAGGGGPSVPGSPRGASILPRLSVKQCRAALDVLWERRREELRAEGAKGEVDFCRRMLAYLDERLSHDVEEALRREEEALLAAAAALDGGGDAPLKPRLEQPRRSGSRDSHPGGEGAGGIDDHDDDRTALLLHGQRPSTPGPPGVVATTGAAALGRGGVGQLLPLSCGHNAPFSEGERARLVFHLASQGWSLDAYGGP